MTLANFLRDLNTRIPKLPDFTGGLVTEGVGAPNNNTSPWFLVYIDSSSDSIYYNPTKAVGGFKLIVDGALLGTGGSVLTVTV